MKGLAAEHRFTLPRATLARLLLFCTENGERAVDVVGDAVLLHLDELEEEERRAAEQDGGAPAPASTSGAPPPDDQVVELPRFIGRAP